MQGKLEASIEAYVAKVAKAELEITSVHLSLNNSAGWPDRIFFLPGGRPAFIEFKKPGEKPVKLQEYRMDQLKRWGYRVIWTSNKKDAIAWLRSLL